MEAFKTAKEVMTAIVAERRFKNALIHGIPQAVDLDYKIGKEVIIYFESKKKWVRLLTVVQLEARIVTLQNFDGEMVKKERCSMHSE